MPSSLLKKILDGLEEVRDHDLFERCVCGLLRTAYPTLVHIHGGQDAGMDGLAAGGPVLIATTGEDALGNLSRNLDSHLAQMGEHAYKQFVFATSRKLTPPERRNLHDRAREKGVELEQTYDRRNLADLLYEKPKWRKALLGIPDDPPALSEVPETYPPLPNLEIVGRAADLEWLRSTSGNRLLFGEPGSGKTFLLRQLVGEGKALFLVSEDWGAVRDDLEEKPDIVIVDDAHLNPDRLVRLQREREDMKVSFDILATCWLGEKEQVAGALSLVEKDTRRLELLTRQEILDVFHQAGVEAASEVMSDLVDQAANKPGLAATLADFWLRGDWKEVLTGEKLRGSLISSLRSILGGEDPTLLLASFALGGDRGMPLDLVAEAIGWSRAQVWELAVRRIAASGVLAPRGEGILAVEPRVLRYALLKEVFFSSRPTPFEYRDALEKAPSTASGVETLVLAAQRGVGVPRGELLEWVRKAGTDAAWESLAYVDRRAALWSLENYPGPVEVVARAALLHAPSEAIQRLLKSAETASSDPDANSAQPMDNLKTWLKQIESTEKLLRRRRLVMQAAKTYLESGGQKSIGLTAIFAALSLRLERDRRTPDRMGFTYQMGHLPVSVIEHVYRMWTEVRASVTDLDDKTWPSLANAVEQWVRPSLPGKAFSDEELQQVWTSARRLLQDLAPLAEGSPGLAAGLTRLASRIDGFDLGLATDPVFETLFPLWTEQGEEQGARLRELALDWAKREPHAVANKLRFYEDEAAKIHHDSTRLTVALCHALVDKADRLDLWLSAFVNHNLPAELVLPVLAKYVEDRPKEWEFKLRHFLDDERYAVSTAELVLQLDSVPDALLATALERLSASPQIVETACLLGKVPVANLQRLLTAEDWQLALAAAVGEWHSGPTTGIRKEVRHEWRNALLRAKTDEYEGVQLSASHQYWLPDMLSSDPGLALGWLRQRLQDADLPGWMDKRGPFAAAVTALTEGQACEFLPDLERLSANPDLDFFVGDLLNLLSESAFVYEQLLTCGDLRRFHLAPLKGVPAKAPWQEMAVIAIDAGYPAEQVAQASFPKVSVIRSTEHWAKWQTAFAEMEKTAEGPLLEVARHGLEIARKKIEEAKKEQRQYELTGHI